MPKNVELLDNANDILYPKTLTEQVMVTQTQTLDKKLSDMDIKIKDVTDEVIDARTDNVKEKVYPVIGERMDSTSLRLVEQAINVKDYEDLVVGNDWTDAFNKAIEVATTAPSLYRRVYVPSGEYLTQGVILPSNIEFFGSGRGLTILKLIPGTKVNGKYKQCLVTNSDWVNGNTNIHVKHMTLDWNNAYGTLRINPGSTSCLFANCENSTMEGLHACGGGLHGLDISNNRYNPYDTVNENGVDVYYELDADGNRTGKKINPTTYERQYRSKNCKIINCSATGATDDNITTHHSDLIVIENCVSYDPKGKVGKAANTNCYEIDDGSTRVTLNNCYAYGGRCVLRSRHIVTPQQLTILLLMIVKLKRTSSLIELDILDIVVGSLVVLI